MDNKTSRASKLAATVLVAVNLIIMVLCAFVFATGLWIIASPNTLSATIQTFGSAVVKTLLSPEVLTIQLGVGLAVLAGFFFFVAFMGLYGAMSRSPFLLFMYATLVLSLLLLESALIYYFTSNLQEKGLQEQDGKWTHALRLVFSCCEHNITSPGELKLPWSCCGTAGYPDNCTVAEIYNKNCHQRISTWLDRYQTAIYASLVVLHTVLSSCSLLRRRRSASRSLR